MGPLTLPSAVPIYLDANIFIYTVERIQPYVSPLDAFWQEVRTRGLDVVTSELSALEVLVGPLKSGNARLEGRYRQILFSSSDVRSLPITLPILERAARLRAVAPALKTPDAIHAATALEANSGLLLTNDPGFRQIANLKVTVLSDLFTP